MFLLLFSYFGIAEAYRARLLFWGIAAALVLRGLAILGGVALIEQFHFVIYVLGVLLLILAYRILQGVDENVDPDKNFVVRRRAQVLPGHARRPRRQRGSRRSTASATSTPIFLCLAAIVAADIAFAVDSIPAAFAITRDSVLIWMGNVFALLGLRALFVLVEGMIRRFRYLDETIAVVLALVAVKLLIEDVYKIGPIGSLAIVAAAFAVGITASIIADRRDPDADAKREERGQRTSRSDERRRSQAARPRRPSPRPRRRATLSGRLPRPQAQQVDDVGGARERVGDDAAVVDRQAATGRPSATASRTDAGQALGRRRGRPGAVSVPASTGSAGRREREAGEEVMGTVSAPGPFRSSDIFCMRPVSSAA